MKRILVRRRGVVGLAALLVAVAAVVVFGPVGDDDVQRAATAAAAAEKPAPSSTPSPTSPPSADATPRRGGAAAPDTTMDPAVAEREAVAALTEYLARVDDVLQNPDADLDAVAEVSSGAAYGEVEAAVAEFEAMGWRQTGAASVVAAEAAKIEVRKAPERVRLHVCVDAGKIDVVDETAASVRTPAGSAPARTLHHYVVTHRDGEWTVTGHSFPDVADC